MIKCLKCKKDKEEKNIVFHEKSNGVYPVCNECSREIAHSPTDFFLLYGKPPKYVECSFLIEPQCLELIIKEYGNLQCAISSFVFPLRGKYLGEE